MGLSAEFLLSSAEAILAEFGEELIYRPKSGTARTVYGVVDRRQVADIPGVPGANTPITTISVKNGASGSYPGITSAEIDTGGDRIDYPVRLGESAQSRRIGRILSQDAGIMTLEVY